MSESRLFLKFVFKKKKNIDNLKSRGHDSLFIVPFEHVNLNIFNQYLQRQS